MSSKLTSSKPLSGKARLALACAAGSLRFAIPARSVVRVLPRQTLLPVPAAPTAVVGMLRYLGQLIPVIDLCQLILHRAAFACPATRMVIVDLTEHSHAHAVKWLALIAEDVLDLVEVEASEVGLSLPDAPWLGDFAKTAQSSLQWLALEKLMPETLAQLCKVALPIEDAP
jgi:chemotaxis-related protein WspB